MKVYVDELPRSCGDCPCHTYNEYWDKNYCSQSDEIVEIEDIYKKPENCPLQSLSDYTKQVRKELIDKLAVFLIATFSKDAEFSVEEILNWFQEVKDQIQGDRQ